MAVSARLGCSLVYDRVLTSALHEDALTAEQRREGRARVERVVAEVDDWLEAMPETPEERAERLRGFAARFGGEVG